MKMKGNGRGKKELLDEKIDDILEYGLRWPIGEREAVFIVHVAREFDFLGEREAIDVAQLIVDFASKRLAMASADATREALCRALRELSEEIDISSMPRDAEGIREYAGRLFGDERLVDVVRGGAAYRE